MWSHAFDFKGVSNRSDYWWASLASFIVAYIFYFLGGSAEIFFSIYFLYCFAQAIPSISLTIRRVRDSGKSWLWIFINLVPLVGPIWFIVILCQPSIPNV